MCRGVEGNILYLTYLDRKKMYNAEPILNGKSKIVVKLDKSTLILKEKAILFQ